MKIKNNNQQTDKEYRYWPSPSYIDSLLKLTIKLFSEIGRTATVRAIFRAIPK